jgi:hypothetical protein
VPGDERTHRDAAVVDDREGKLPPVAPATAAMIASYLGKPAVSPPTNWSASHAEGRPPDLVSYSLVVSSSALHSVYHFLGSGALVCQPRVDGLFAPLCLSRTIFWLRGDSRTRLSCAVDRLGFLKGLPPADTECSCSLVLCNDGWFVVNKSDASVRRVGFPKAVRFCRDQILQGNSGAASAVLTAVRGFLSFYMYGAPVAWGPLLDEVASAVNEIESLFTSPPLPGRPR